ncbi:hypothetical protein NQ176_g10530 [Zarea fungicola]|uniref:Uncharacterized protein n=1 Tax=Zarea fungicola TaxID=93591 RepID=A0ACC1MGZ7_9HYPO|nr:hypothetical protein NQ176_g10530 [Lecanicillium fungicola]
MRNTLTLTRRHTRRAAIALTQSWQRRIGLDTGRSRINSQPPQNAQYFSNSSSTGKASSPEKTEERPKGHDTVNQARKGDKHQPLSLLPLAMILRSLFTSTVSSSPKLLAVSLYLLRILAHTNVRLLDPDHNRLLRYVLNQSLYKQFCAGQDADKVAKTVAQGKHIGFTGAILAYAKESPEHDQGSSKKTEAQNADREISEWLKNSLETVRLVTAGDFVALKYIYHFHCRSETLLTLFCFSF